MLDWVTLEVRFLGAIDEDERASEKMAEAVRDVCFEMSLYLGEDNRHPNANGDGGGIGVYLALHLLTLLHLPPRLRASKPADNMGLLVVASGSRKVWGADLERRCSEIGVPFIRLPHGVQPPSFPLETFGLKWNAVARKFEMRGRARKR